MLFFAKKVALVLIIFSSSSVHQTVLASSGCLHQVGAANTEAPRLQSKVSVLAPMVHWSAIPEFSVGNSC